MSGSGTATSSTKSHSPFEAILSSVSSVICLKTSSHCRTMRGVKPRLIRLRISVWWGSSSSIMPILALIRPGRTPWPEQNVSWLFETCTTSS